MASTYSEDKQKAGKVKPGPEADTVKVSGEWEDAVGKALERKRPAGGWPRDDKKSD